MSFDDDPELPHGSFFAVATPLRYPVASGDVHVRRTTPTSALAPSAQTRRWPLHSCRLSNTSLGAIKTMAPIIAAKNMAGKQAVESSMPPRVLAPASLHKAIVCANRWFCWQRQHDHEATAALRHCPLCRCWPSATRSTGSTVCDSPIMDICAHARIGLSRDLVLAR